MKDEASKSTEQLKSCISAFSSCKKLEDKVAAAVFECHNPTTTVLPNTTVVSNTTMVLDTTVATNTTMVSNTTVALNTTMVLNTTVLSTMALFNSHYIVKWELFLPASYGPV